MSKDFINYRVRIRFKSYRTLSISRRELRMPEWKRFLQYHEEMEKYKKSLPSKNCNFRNMWICKPGENTNRGNGITVCYSLDDIKIRLNGR
jgi:hypothetical protein